MATIILCLSDEVLCNMTNEEITVDLWHRLESLYMTKSLSKQALYEEAAIQPSDKERYAYSTTSKCFNRILSDLLALEVKLEEDKALLLLFFSIKL